MNKEEMIEIGEYLNTLFIIHRDVEHDSPFTKQERWLKKLYDEYLDLKIEHNELKQKLSKSEAVRKEAREKLDNASCQYIAVNKGDYDIVYEDSNLVDELLDILDKANND